MSSQRGFKKEVKYFFIYHSLRFVIWVACTLERKTALSFFGKLAKMVFFFFPKEKEKMVRHLKMAFGPENSDQHYAQMADRVAVNIGKNAVDIMRYRLINSIDDYRKIVRVNGEEHFKSAFSEGKGVVALTCHLGAFEMVGTFLLQSGYDMVGVGATLKDPRLNALLVNNRTLKGGEFVERGENTIKLFRSLKEGKVVLILIDQDTVKAKGVFVDFFGKKAYTPIGASLLAMRTGAKVVPIAIHRQTDDIHELNIKPAIDLVSTGNQEEDLLTNTQLLSHALEDFIRQAPEQWVWMHERWKTRPPEEMA